MSNWIFQANPNRFRVDRFFDETPDTVRWITPQHSSRMNVGDTVYIWRSKANGKDYQSGIIAECHIKIYPRQISDDPATEAFWNSESDKGKVLMRVDLSVNKIFKPIKLSRSIALSHPVLQDCDFVKGRQQTNFPIDHEVAAAIRSYVERE